MVLSGIMLHEAEWIEVFRTLEKEISIWCVLWDVEL